MPQASEYLRSQFKDDYEATNILYLAGYRLQRNWCWTMPAGHSMTQQEADALDYLIDEWDYGGIVNE